MIQYSVSVNLSQSNDAWHDSSVGRASGSYPLGQGSESLSCYFPGCIIRVFLCLLLCYHQAMILVVLLIILAVIAVVTYLVGSFFVDYSITRKERDPASFIPSDEIKACDRVDVNKNKEIRDRRVEEFHRNTYTEHPEIRTKEGFALRSSYYPHDGHKYAIMIHGYTGSRREMQSIASMYYSWGFSVLTPDNRAHGESEGKYIGMGWLDKDDIQLWMEWIRNKDKDAKIVIQGCSMGAATVMMTAGDNPPGLVAAVEDCGYTSVWDIFSDELKTLFHLPAFPVLYMCDVVARLKAGYSIRKASSVEQLKKTSIPMLFIHGSNDRFVRSSMLDENYDAKVDGPKEKLLVEGAAHGESEVVAPDLYYRTIHDFLGKYV